MIADFLKDFWAPLIQTIKPDDVEYKSKFDFSVYSMSDVLVQLNKTTPHWLFFTPNGNYWDLQEVWKKIVRNEGSHWQEPYMNALVIDVDIKWHFKSKDECLAHIADVRSRFYMKPTRVVESWWWYHMYWIIDPAERKLCMWLDMFRVSRFMTTLFIWWDMNCQATSKVSWLMRLPWSLHHKSKTPFEVKIIEYNPESKYKASDIEMSLKYLDSIESNNKPLKEFQTMSWMSKFTKVNDIPFSDIFIKLEKYPKYMGWQSYIFKLASDNSIAIVSQDSEVTETNWYKYWKEKNAVHCFSRDRHPINERPIGWVYAFLYHYFDKKHANIFKFLKNEFNIDAVEWNYTDWEWLEMKLEEDWYTIEFTNKRVSLIRNTDVNKTIVRSDLLRMPMKIIGKSKSKVTQTMWESDVDQKIYLIEYDWNNDILYRFTTKKKFNEKYWHTLFYYWDDNDLWLLYEAIDKSEKVPFMETIALNWVYDECVVLWWKVIYWKTNAHIAVPQNMHYDLSNWEQTTIKEFIKKLCECYDENVAVPIVLQAVAMALMNKRDTKKLYAW
jgi:hypothetical protein